MKISYHYFQTQVLVLASLICLISFQPTSASTDSAPSFSELKALFKKDAYSDVYVMGQSMLFEHEGNTEFDFMYGLSSIETGHVDEGVFIFERLVESKPSNLRYRLELARGYFLKGEFVKSKAVFTAILNANAELPEPVVEKVTGFLQAIDDKRKKSFAQKKHAFNGFVGVGLGYDDNAGSVSSNDVFLVSDPSTGATGSLPFGNEETATSYASTQMGGQYTRFINSKNSLVFLGVGQHKNNYKSEAYQYEIGSMMLGLDWKRLMNNNLVTVGGRFTTVRRAGEDLYDNSNFRINVKRAVRKPFADILTGEISYSAIRYDETAESSSTDATRLSFGGSKRSNKYNNNVFLVLGQDEAVLSTAQYNSRDYYGLSYTLTYSYTQHWDFSASVFLENSSFDEVFPSSVNQPQASGSLDKRDGVFSTVSLGSSYLVNKDLQLYVKATSFKSDSELNLYKFTKNMLEMGTVYQF